MNIQHIVTYIVLCCVQHLLAFKDLHHQVMTHAFYPWLQCSALFQSDWYNLNNTHFHADLLSIQILVSLKGHAQSCLLPEVFILLTRPQQSCSLLNLSWTNLYTSSSRDLAHTILYIIELFMYACLLYPKTIDCKLLEQKYHVLPLFIAPWVLDEKQFHVI